MNTQNEFKFNNDFPWKADCLELDGQRSTHYFRKENEARAFIESMKDLYQAIELFGKVNGIYTPVIITN